MKPVWIICNEKCVSICTVISAVDRVLKIGFIYFYNLANRNQYCSISLVRLFLIFRLCTNCAFNLLKTRDFRILTDTTLITVLLCKVDLSSFIYMPLLTALCLYNVDYYLVLLFYNNCLNKKFIFMWLIDIISCILFLNNPQNYHYNVFFSIIIIYILGSIAKTMVFYTKMTLSKLGSRPNAVQTWLDWPCSMATKHLFLLL